MLAHDIRFGVEELDISKLVPLLRLKNRKCCPEAGAGLGQPETIQEWFSGFQ